MAPNARGDGDLGSSELRCGRVAPVDHARFLRQILVPEVGERGQGALAEATAAVGGATAAHAVAVIYAERAGFAGVDDGEIDVDALAPAFVVDPAARHVLAGARAALAAIRAAIAPRSRDGGAP